MKLSLLRGAALREHLRALSSRYAWRELVGREVEALPRTITKRRPKRERASIFQTPVRHIVLEDKDSAGESPLQAVSPVHVVRPSTADFLAGMDDASSEEEVEEEGQEQEEEEEVNVSRRLSRSLSTGRSPNMAGIMEYVPAPRPTKSRPGEGKGVKAAQVSSVHETASTVAPLASAKKTPGKNAFHKERQAITRDLFVEYNAKAFKSQLPADLSIKWNKRLLTTAGITKLRLNGDSRLASVELSEKVLDDAERLKNTLLHELCHAAAWIVDGERRPPHGRCFWRWAKIVSNAVPGANITTCHSYIIHKPFRFKCTNPSCETIYSRHSKSIDTETHRCGACRSTIAYEGKVDSNGTAKKPAQAKGFSAFVQDHFAATREKLEREYVERERKEARLQQKQRRSSSPSVLSPGIHFSPASPKRPATGQAKSSAAKALKTKSKVAHADVMQALSKAYKADKLKKAAANPVDVDDLDLDLGVLSLCDEGQGKGKRSPMLSISNLARGSPNNPIQLDL